MKKKLLTLVLSVAMLLPITVNAATITAQDISDKMNENLAGLKELQEAAMALTQIIQSERPEMTSQIDGIENLYDESKFEITATDNEIIVKNEELNLQTIITYNNSILEFDYPGDKTNLNFKEYLFGDLVSRILVASAYSTKGYDKTMIENYIESIDSATLNGVGFEVTGLVFNEGTADEIESIDTLKIDMSRIAIPESEKTPVLTISDVTSTSSNITATWESATEENQMCMIYRAKENENFEYIMSIGCYGSITIGDTSLEPNTKYKYKAVGTGYSNFSDTVEIKTLKAEKDEVIKPTSNTVENPKTGVASYGTIGLLAIIALGGTYIVYKKKMSN